MTLEEAAVGCIKVLRGKVTDVCATCAGAGHQVLGGNCARCGGSGAIPKRSFFGWPTGVSECEACLGGGIARQPCAACGGAGKMEPRGYKMNVRIPHGVRDGDLLHVDGRRVRADGPPADVEIRVEVSEHAFFKLDDDGTIRCEMPVDGFAWIANRQIKVPTVTGFQALQLNRDRLSYRLKGQGFPVQRRGSRGDQSGHAGADISAAAQHRPADPARPALGHDLGGRTKLGRAPSRMEPRAARLGARVVGPRRYRSLMRAACAASSARKAGCAMPMSSRARCFADLPRNCATPYSVTT